MGPYDNNGTGAPIFSSGLAGGFYYLDLDLKS